MISGNYSGLDYFASFVFWMFFAELIDFLSFPLIDQDPQSRPAEFFVRYFIWIIIVNGKQL